MVLVSLAVILVRGASPRATAVVLVSLAVVLVSLAVVLVSLAVVLVGGSLAVVLVVVVPLGETWPWKV